MKKYAGLIPIAMVVLMVLSWYMLFSDNAKVANQYDEYISLARDYANTGVTKLAIENYKKAIEVKSTPEIYAEIADYYISQSEQRAYIDWCETFLTDFPTNAMSYEYAIDAYISDGDYESCFDVIETASKRGIKSDKLSQKEEELKYEHYLGLDTYTDVSIFSNNFCAVKIEEKWGYVDRFGKIKVPVKLSDAGAFTASGYAPVISGKGEAYFIDKAGDKILAQAQNRFTKFGPLSGERIAACDAKGVYSYLDQNLNEVNSGYEYAGTFNSGVAAVKRSGKWYLIDKDGNEIGNAYIDIKMDEKGIAVRNDRAFVSISENQYIMVDTKGQQIGNESFDDAVVFGSVEGKTAVKKNGKWFFIDKEGKHASEKTYQCARSFSNDLAAVCIDGKWGFVDESETLVIQTEFEDAKDFNELGSCFVKTENNWRLLIIYRLNRS